MKKLLLKLITIFCTGTFILVACSAEPLPSVNINGEGAAIKGYDPVAYFTMSRPVKGLADFQFEWNNATWRFANKEHLAMFQMSPKKFAPQYGGY